MTNSLKTNGIRSLAHVHYKTGQVGQKKCLENSPDKKIRYVERTSKKKRRQISYNRTETCNDQQKEEIHDSEAALKHSPYKISPYFFFLEATEVRPTAGQALHNALI